MFDFWQISANDDCPANKAPYHESHKTKTSMQINKKKTYHLSLLQINWLKSKSQFPAVHFFWIDLVSYLAVGGACVEKIPGGNQTHFKMSQIQQCTSPNSPRHHCHKMDNPLSTKILPWTAVLLDELCSMSEDMEKCSALCTATSKSRIPTLSPSYLQQIKLSPSF